MIVFLLAAVATADPPLLRELPNKGHEQAQPPIVRQPPQGIPALMPIYGVSAGDRGVTVQLPTSGCPLTKADFTVAISKSADRPTILIARRSRADSLVLCKGQPPAIDVTWSYADLGLSAGQPFSLANPLVRSP